MATATDRAESGGALPIERETVVELGAKRFAQLKELLIRAWESPLVG